MSIAFNSEVTLTVGIAFGNNPFDASPTWTDVSADLVDFSVRRGMSTQANRVTPGSLTMRLRNDSDQYNPWNTGSSYYPDVKLSVPVRIQATHNAVTYGVFRGFVVGWDFSWDQTLAAGEVTLEALDGMHLLNQAAIPAETAFTEQSTDARIGAVLDGAGWPAGLRNLSTGIATCQAYTLPIETSVLQHLEAVAIAEYGRFFINADGEAAFTNRLRYDGRTRTETFLSTTTTSHNRYSQIRMAYDDAYVINRATVTREYSEQVSEITDESGTVVAVSPRIQPGLGSGLFGRARGVRGPIPDEPTYPAPDFTAKYTVWKAKTGNPQTVEDSTSQTSYGERSVSVMSEALLDDNAALNVAEWIILEYSDARFRVDQLEVRPARVTDSYPTGNVSYWDDVLPLDIDDMIEIQINGLPGGGTAFSSAEVIITGVEHQVSKADWVIRYTVREQAPEMDNAFWVVGSNSLGTSTYLL